MSPFCELVSEICTITAMKYQPLLKRNPKNDERAEQVKLNVNLRGLLIHLHSRFLYTVSVLEVYDVIFNSIFMICRYHYKILTLIYLLI